MQPAGIKQATGLLQRGGVVVIPTDTAYGLAADPRIKSAVKRIFKIKQRPPEKALPWVAGSLAQVERHFLLTAAERRVATALWPGPLSLVLRLRRGRQRIAVRVPALALLRKLCLLVGYPLTATSANISGRPTAYSIASVKRQFVAALVKPDAIIDGGTLHRRAPSTIADLSGRQLRLHRVGPISLALIKKYV